MAVNAVKAVKAVDLGKPVAFSSKDPDDNGLGVGMKEEYDSTTTTTTPTSKAAETQFNQPGNFKVSQMDSRTFQPMDEDSVSCCQKAGNCFRGFFSKKTKTE